MKMQSGIKLKERVIYLLATLRITVNGITDTVKGWSERTGISKKTIYKRIKNGSCYDAVTAKEARAGEEKRALVRELWHGEWIWTGGEGNG